MGYAVICMTHFLWNYIDWVFKERKNSGGIKNGFENIIIVV